MADLGVRSPELLLNAVFVALLAPCALLQVARRAPQKTEDRDEALVEDVSEHARAGSALRWRYLGVFWAYKMADWLQGPYAHVVYSSKTIRGRPMSDHIISKLFLASFGTSAALGASVGALVDMRGRRAGSLAFAFFYAVSALSMHARALTALVAGRVCGGIGSSLLSSAPEAWLVSEQARLRLPGTWLNETFAWAYLGDSVIAILAGQLASAVAGRWGPLAPFVTSQAFLLGGAAVAASCWQENVATVEPPHRTMRCPSADEAVASREEDWGFLAQLREARRAIFSDSRVLCVGAVQSLFEGSMYIFVMQWPIVVKGAMSGVCVPFGKVFSCLMASCMLGSTAFSRLGHLCPLEQLTAGMLAVASGSLLVASRGTSLASVLPSFFVFEACVGMYFPSAGALRTRYIPDASRGSVAAAFQVPLNLLVVVVLLAGRRLGSRGALLFSSAALQLALLAQLRLCSLAGTKSPS